MIYVRLHGRLGNQLFEYAAARGLAALHNTQVALDSRMLHAMGDKPAAQHFFWKTTEPDRLPPTKRTSPVRYALWRGLRLTPRLLREGPDSEDTFLKAPDGSYLHGYWQRPHYFAHIERELREELRFATPAQGRNAEMADQIAAQTSISVHVRRGDFEALGLVTPTEFYHRAIATLTDMLGSEAHIFFFSDSPDWVRANLAPHYASTVVDFNGPDADFEDLRLISLCQHNIISLSSFSWWGGWLNSNPDKIVIGPGPAERPRERGWYPQGWRRVPVAA
ncbi:MAG: alpha-1,2-fucosyltransferase [Pseudomonadota bacterium]